MTDQRQHETIGRTGTPGVSPAPSPGTSSGASSGELERMLDAALAKLEAVQRSHSEPIAIIGAGCRLPGAANPEAYWRLLRDGVDAVGEIPPERWNADTYYDPDPEAPGRMYVRRGGFLSEVDQFDARFFEISPREAASMDPQQRLLLEVAWEALEDAGVVPARLADSPTGVFIGATTNDYAGLMLRGGAAGLDAYFSTGNALNAMAGRLAYVLGLHGPSLVVDTACSSSLVAVHLACQSLRAQECDAALVGGVNLMLAPEITVAICRARMLAPDGRCKTFDAMADGYVRGEGCGMIVLKRRSDALAAGDRVLAWIRGTAVNQDGATSGFTVPNGRAQQALIRRALANAKVAPADIDYLEAHGTGTRLGDPIELQSADAVLREGRAPQQKLLVGSAKTNIGHLEAAAGVAGLLKTVLALRRGELPPHLHYHTPSPHIPWSDLALEVVTRCRSWPERDRPHLAAVSSFGASGTNAHAILERAADPPPARLGPARPFEVLALSAKTEPAMRQLAGRYVDFLTADPVARWHDVCGSANTGRSHFTCRMAIVAAGASEALQRLRDGTGTARGPMAAGPLKPAFLFTGQGAHHIGMGRQLYGTEPRFREIIDRCASVLRDVMARPLYDLLHGTDDSWLLDTALVQPALFSLQCALAALWQAWGVHPAACAGHSVGEFAAACVAGVFSFEDGARLVARRGALMQQLTPDGAMAAVSATADAVAAMLVSGVSVAAVNAPDQIVIAGTRSGIDATLTRLAAAGIRTARLRGVHGFHSPHIEPMLAAFAQAARAVSYARPRLPLISGLTGGLASSNVATPDYWVRHARETVRFAAAVDTLVACGCNAFVEIGPDCTLLSLGRLCQPDPAGLWLPSLGGGNGRGEDQDRRTILQSLACLYEHGAAIDWPAVAGHGWARVPVPGYPWQRERHWLPATPPPAPVDQASELPDSDLLYQVAWRPQPAVPQHAAADFWPVPAAQAAIAGDLLARLAPEHADPAYCSALLQLETLSLRYIVAAWEQLGWRFAAGSRGRLDDLALRFGVADRHRRLLYRTAEILLDAGLLRRDGEDLVAVATAGAPRAGEPGRQMERLLEQAPAAIAECTLLERCGQRLAQVLSGRQEALPLLFPAGDALTAGSFYGDAPGARMMNRVIGETVEHALQRLPARRRLRVLEIGAGTGVTTAELLRILPADRMDYVFTDISVQFTTMAAARFAGHSALRCRTLDIERDPGEQGFPSAGFDLIVAVNVLHATRDLRQSLRHVRDLIAPGGMLVLLEGTEPINTVDLVFGLTDGWWRFEDDRTYPLVPAGTWVRLLSECGFEAAPVSLPPAPWGLLARQALILARAKAEPAGATPLTGEPSSAAANEDRPITGATVPDRHVVILADRSGVGESLAVIGGRAATLVHDDTAAMDVLIALATRDASVPIELVHLAGLNEPELDAAADVETIGQASCAAVLRLTRALTDAPQLSGRVRLWLVTRGATGAGPLPGLAQATLWGLGRVVSQEHPELRPVRVDLDPDASAEVDAQRLWDELQTVSSEDELRFRADRREVARLERCRDIAPAVSGLSADATYLISGGLGALGRLTARWLAEQGAGAVVLVGRSHVDVTAAAECRALQATGTRVVTYEADIACPDQVARLLSGIAASLPPLRGIVHAAGVLDDGMLRQMDWSRFGPVLRPKVAGAWNLHCATAAMELDFFVLYSSFTAIVGTPGQANHAAANAFLDALAWHRRALGLPALSLNWGAWADIGAAARRQIAPRLAAQGSGTIVPRQGLRLLAQSWNAATPQRAIVPICWDNVAAAQMQRPLLADFVTSAPAPSQAPTPEPDLRSRLLAAPPRRRRGLLVEHVAAEAAKVLGLSNGHMIGVTEGFFEFGMDSLTSVELRNRLGTSLACDLPTTLAFDHPTPEAVADFVLARLEIPSGATAGTRGPDPAALSVEELDALIDELARSS
jgi:acyl transferase domain-containing protein/SAM-dependent methyltransferase/NAD(P)-dependent dehydrogenase (short-subunit alcohol dehydrogenase family)